MKKNQIINPHISLPGYKLSYYNYFQTYDTGNTVVYNTLYKSLLVFNSKEMDAIEAGQMPDICQKELIDNHILVPENLDEQKSYEDAYLKANSQSEVLSLTIMPTLSCNCACPYCFERKSKVKMSRKTEADILKWIEQQLPNYKALSVDWFGGEPLLYQDIIKRMSEYMIAKCKELNVMYTASITTNGVLMNSPEVIEMLQQNAIYNIQINFDGDKKAHDSQKFLHGGKGTYDQLLDNVSLFCDSNPQSLLRIRVNVSDNNYHTIDSLLNDLLPYRNYIIVFFRWVYANGASNWQNYSQKEKGENPYKGIYQLQMKAIEKGFMVDDQYDKHQFRFSHCEADSQGYYNIDPLGNIYMCVHEYAPQYAVGNVIDGILDEKKVEYENYRKTSILNDSECRTCKVLPMCNGGCRRYRINHGTHLCIDEKQSMDLYIDMLYHKSSLSITQIF